MIHILFCKRTHSFATIGHDIGCTKRLPIGCNLRAILVLSWKWKVWLQSYENLVNRRNSQLTANLIAGIDCMNGTARWSAQINTGLCRKIVSIRMPEAGPPLKAYPDSQLTRRHHQLCSKPALSEAEWGRL